MAKADGFSFVLTSLTQRFTDSTNAKLLPRRDLTRLSGQEWSNSLVGVVSPDKLAAVCSPDIRIRSAAEGTILQEVNWAVHMNIAAVMFEPDKSLFTNEGGQAGGRAGRAGEGLGECFASLLHPKRLASPPSFS